MSFFDSICQDKYGLVTIFVRDWMKLFLIMLLVVSCYSLAAPRTENRVRLGADHARGGPKRALKSVAPRKTVRKVIGATGGGGRCTMVRHGPAA